MERTPMKILIGYDGSRCADDAILDLGRAGLPDDLDAHILSVAEVWLAADESKAQAGTVPPPVPRSVQRAHERAQAVVEAAAAEAATVAERLRQAHPGWKVTAEGVADSPAWGLLRRGEAMGADLIVVGSHGKSALGRFVMGSVSQKVLTEARCSVRIARGHPSRVGEPVRLVLAYDGSPDADRAVEGVVSRNWPSGTAIHLLSVLDPVVASPDPPLAGSVEWGDEAYEKELHWVLDAHNRQVERLASCGLIASSKILEGDPRRTIPREAEAWGSDCVFLGARGLTAVERFLLGSVSAAIAARAHCTVEVIR